MERETKSLVVTNVTLFDRLEAELRAGKQVADAGRTEILFQHTVQFSGDIQMDIKVVNSEDGPWTEGVLFDLGGEIGCTEVGDSLAGEYIVPAYDKEFSVIVRRLVPTKLEWAASRCEWCKTVLEKINKGEGTDIDDTCEECGRCVACCGDDGTCSKFSS
jgi:hypothetical protein